MKLSYLLLISGLGTAALLTSCKEDDEAACIGGDGGQLTIVATLEHHGDVIPNSPGYPDTVWVKYNTQEWSNAPLGYDKQVIGEEGEDHVHITGLKCGKYYLYASGFDTTIQMVVRGGIPISTNQSTGELMIDIPATE